MDSVLGMIRPNFLSADDRLELERCVRRHREDHGTARSANAILLLDRGKSCAQIAEFLISTMIRSVAGTRLSLREDGMPLHVMAGRADIRALAASRA